MVLGLLQVNIHGNVIPLMPSPSIWFTGHTEVIAKLKWHFFTSTDDAEEKVLPVIWNGQYWEDSDLLKVC